MQQHIRFFISAKDLAPVIGDGNIHGLFLDLGFKEDEKIVIRLRAVDRNDGNPKPADRDPGTAIPTPPGGTQMEFFLKNLPEGSPTFDHVYKKG